VSSCLDLSRDARRLGLFDAADQSYDEFLADKWQTIFRELDLGDSETRTALAELREMLRPWAARPIGQRCEPPSFVSEDGFPAELSLSWRNRRPEVRILFESLGDDPTARGCQEAGRRLTGRLARKPGVSLDRYQKIEDLFLAADPDSYRPTVWHSLAWHPGGTPGYKVYLNPQVQGEGRSYEVVGEAMARLGLSSAWRPLWTRARELADAGHELEFFALDLAAAPESRVKIYFRHPAVALSEWNRVAAFARYHDSQRAAHAQKMIYGGSDGTVDNEPMTCLAFRQGADEPEEANIYLRLPGNVRSDAEAYQRIAGVMRCEGIDPEPYSRVLAGLAPRPLDTTVGLQELVSYRTTGARRTADVGVYLRFSTYDSPAARPV
jgi:DMATS type aromatic prenyltransferase